MTELAMADYTVDDKYRLPHPEDTLHPELGDEIRVQCYTHERTVLVLELPGLANRTEIMHSTWYGRIVDSQEPTEIGRKIGGYHYEVMEILE